MCDTDLTFGLTMAPIPTLHALLIERLKELHDTEHGVIKLLPRLIRAAANPSLRKALNHSLTQTRRQAIRLAESQRTLGLPPTGKACHAMHGLVEDAAEAIGLRSPAPVRDAALIGAAQRIQLYRMAGYHAASQLAAACGESRVAEQLKESWREEKVASAALTEISGIVNTEALAHTDEENAPPAAESGGDV